MDHTSAAVRALACLSVPAGRKGLTTAQYIALAQAEATLAVAAELRLANQIAALSLGVAPLDHDEDGLNSTSSRTRARTRRRNALRADIRGALGLEDGAVES